MAVGHTASAQATGETLALRRAAEELGLTPRELDIAVQLEEVRTVGAGVGRRRVTRDEVERLKAAEGFPDALRERLRVVSTTRGAELMGISPSRFTRLARVGCFSPVRFYVNRYRAVVWLYSAGELLRFAERQPALLTGPTPVRLRAMLDAGEDWRARNWRSRRIGQLVRQLDDPWERAAVSAAVLGPDQLAEVVDDPYERAYLRKLRPALVPVRDELTTTREVVEKIVVADDPDEILWHRISLVLTLDEARADRPAPRPGTASRNAMGLGAVSPGTAPPGAASPALAPPGAAPPSTASPSTATLSTASPSTATLSTASPGAVPPGVRRRRRLRGWLRRGAQPVAG
ncbi:DUF6397 family protein [Streptomyces sp. URMC 123]|uniref:DUF6397 family protein n=1 Tax=Streptomyces sp. URMC 123 TaxID=3423403 RepID=UPI003F1B20F3